MGLVRGGANPGVQITDKSPTGWPIRSATKITFPAFTPAMDGKFLGKSDPWDNCWLGECSTPSHPTARGETIATGTDPVMVAQPAIGPCVRPSAKKDNYH